MNKYLNTTNPHKTMNWIRQDKRLAIYLRDRHTCVWCNKSYSEVSKLSLDHVIPWEQGGSNGEDNVVVACLSCNNSRGQTPIAEYAKTAAANRKTTAAAILKEIRRRCALDLSLFRAKAKLLMAKHGSAKQVMVATRGRA